MIVKKSSFVIALTMAVIFTFGAFGYLKSQTPFKDNRQISNVRVVRSKRLSLVATAERDTASGAVILKWSLKNISKTDIDLVSSNTFREYSIDVVDEQGNPAPLTEQGKQVLAASYFSSRRLMRLHPGEEIRKQLDLSEYFKLESNANYSIRVSRKIASPDHKTLEEARSEAVKLTVKE